MEIENLIYDITDKKRLKELYQGKINFYLGIDPTAPSLHLGHLSTLIFAKHLIAKGNKCFIVVGGGTAMIGDPSGKSSEREMLDSKTIAENTKRLLKQLKAFFGLEVTFLNNKNWLNISLIDFLKNYGKTFNVNTMIKKETVFKRLESGISFTEFSYQALQGYDFYKLAKDYNVTMQFGGQDQWVNITSGTELIRKKGLKVKPFGITIPLVTKADGKKFGKSESETIWLDKKLTNPYILYQYLFNTVDDDVLNLIKALTMASQRQYEKLKKELKKNSKERKAQKFLAKKVTEFVHGEVELEKALKLTKALFSGSIAKIKLKDLEKALINVETTKIKGKFNIQDLLVKSKAVKSKRVAREMIGQGSIMVNGIKITNQDKIFTKKDAMESKVFIIKKGKRNYFIAKY